MKKNLLLFALGLVTFIPAPARQCDGVRLHCPLQRMAIQGHQV